MTYSKLYHFTENRQSIIVGIMKITDDIYGVEHIIIRIEGKANPNIFAEISLPEYKCYKSYGFSENDLIKINDYLLHNEALIWDCAKGVINCA